MYTTTRRTSTILAIVVVAATALTLLSSTAFTSSAFAAKTGSSGTKNLKNLFACQSSAANGHFGQLTETAVMDCYSQAFSSSLGVSGNNNNPASDTGSASST